MFLPEFNLMQVIQDYNQRKNKFIKITGDLDFPYFNPTVLKNCQQIIATINDSADLFFLSEPEAELILKRRTKLNAWRTYAKSNTDSVKKILTCFEQAYVLPPDIAAKKAFYAWRKQYYAIFQATDHWIDFVKPITVPLSELRTLKAYWKTQAPLALQSADAIEQIAFEWLPHLIQYHQQALKSLKWSYFSMPKTIYVAYKNYLNNFLVQGKQLKQQLAQSMLARLKVFDESGFKHANIMVHLAEALKLKHPPCIERLTAFQFFEFNHYIEQHGDRETKAQLKTLSWFQPHSQWSTLTTTDKVPKQKRKPAWLFHGANLRHAFCKQHALDFVLLEQLPDMSTFQSILSKPNNLDLDFVKTTLATLHEKQTLAEQLLLVMQQPPYGDLRRWHWRTHRFLNHHRQLLQTCRQKIMTTKLAIAKQWVKHLFHSNDKFLCIWRMPFEAREILSTLLQGLAESCKTQDPIKDKELTMRYQLLQNQCSSSLALNRVIQFLQEIEQGDLIGENNLQYIKIVTDHNEHANHPMWQQFSQEVANKVLQQLLQELKHNPETMRNERQCHKHAATLRQCCTVLQILATQSGIDIVAKTLIQYFSHYLNAILRCGTETKSFTDKSIVLNTFETVLGLFPQTSTVFIGNYSIAEYLNNFKNWRTENNWIETQTEAETLATFLGEKFLIKHINKACHQFDAQIKALFIDDEVTCHLVFKVRDQLIKTGKSTLDEETLTTLKTHEQVLLGTEYVANAETNNRAFIPALVELSSQAHYLQQAVHSDSLPYVAKVQQVEQFDQTLQKTIQALKQKHSSLQAFGQSKKAQSLFFKIYNPPAESPHQTATSNLSNFSHLLLQNRS